MSRSISLCRSILKPAAGLVAGLFLVASAYAEDPCGVCNDEVVVSAALANCFLEKYQQFADKTAGVVAVDLSDCPAERDIYGVVVPLPQPGIEITEPDLKFMVTKGQLACIKIRLEQPGLVIDPLLKIDLASCA